MVVGGPGGESIKEMPERMGGARRVNVHKAAEEGDLAKMQVVVQCAPDRVDERHSVRLRWVGAGVRWGNSRRLFGQFRLAVRALRRVGSSRKTLFLLLTFFLL